MLFSSLPFLLFFLVYFLCHLLTTITYRNYLIIIGSSVFYAWWRPTDIWVPFLLTGIAYFGSITINKSEPSYKRLLLVLTLLLLYMPLVIYKYYGFIFNDLFSPIVGIEQKAIAFSIPLGISFVTFTMTSYLVDIYMGKYKSIPSLPTFLSYTLFFPQLIAGPILRPNELIPQLENPKRAQKLSFKLPLLIFTLGLCKKILFADYLSYFVDRVFTVDLTTSNAWECLLGIYAFSVQIYCDFSGYTDMAIGTALLLGINLPSNFLTPYNSFSIVEFWRRWHITLSDFLRDYIYIPMGGSYHGVFVRNRNLLITMLIGGLWHGASLTFVFWGFIHGLALVIAKLNLKTFNFFKKLPGFCKVILTFNFVTFSWIFFRSQNFNKAFEIFKNIFTGDYSGFSSFLTSNQIPIFFIIFFLLTHKFDSHKNISNLIKIARPEIFWPCIASLWFLVIGFSQGGSGAFIYFDF